MNNITRMIASSQSSRLIVQQLTRVFEFVSEYLLLSQNRFVKSMRNEFRLQWHDDVLY